MTVYPDLAFILGVECSASVYMLNLYLLNLRRPLWRILVGVFLSSLSFSLAVMPGFPGIFSVLMGIGSPVLVFWGKSFYGTVKNTLSFYAVTLVFCGLFFLFSILFMPVFSVLPEGGYFELSFLKTSLCVGFSFLVAGLSVRLCRRRMHMGKCCNCVAVVSGKTVPFRAYVDTGNFLHDPTTGLPVVIMEHRVFVKYWGTPLPSPGSYEFMTFFADRIRIIPYRTVSGDGDMLSGIIPDSFFIEGVSCRVVLALSERVLEGSGRFSGIVGPDLIGGSV